MEYGYFSIEEKRRTLHVYSRNRRMSKKRYHRRRWKFVFRFFIRIFLGVGRIGGVSLFIPKNEGKERCSFDLVGNLCKFFRFLWSCDSIVFLLSETVIVVCIECVKEDNLSVFFFLKEKKYQNLLFYCYFFILFSIILISIIFNFIDIFYFTLEISSL